MEKMQNKLETYERKFGSAEYLEMNKKENEILILRAENSNLKNSIAITEKSLEDLQVKFSSYTNEKEKILMKNQELISILTKKVKKLEESTLIENLTNSNLDKNENSKILNFSKRSKEKSNTIIAHSSRIASGANMLNFFHSDGKGKLTNRKFSNVEPVGYIDNFEKQNNNINAFNAEQLSYEKISESSSDEQSQKLSKLSNRNHKVYSSNYQKINKSSKLLENESEKPKIKNSVENNVIKIFFSD